MDDASRRELADSLERLADQADWNPALWQRCHDLVERHRDDELLGYVYDEIVHYSGGFQSPNVFGLRVRPRRNQLELYRKELCVIANAGPRRLPLSQMKKPCDFQAHTFRNFQSEMEIFAIRKFTREMPIRHIDFAGPCVRMLHASSGANSREHNFGGERHP